MILSLPVLIISCSLRDAFLFSWEASGVFNSRTVFIMYAANTQLSVRLKAALKRVYLTTLKDINSLQLWGSCGKQSMCGHFKVLGGREYLMCCLLHCVLVQCCVCYKVSLHIDSPAALHKWPRSIEFCCRQGYGWSDRVLGPHGSYGKNNDASCQMSQRHQWTPWEEDSHTVEIGFVI